MATSPRDICDVLPGGYLRCSGLTYLDLERGVECLDCGRRAYRGYEGFFRSHVYDKYHLMLKEAQNMYRQWYVFLMPTEARILRRECGIDVERRGLYAERATDRKVYYSTASWARYEDVSDCFSQSWRRKYKLAGIDVELKNAPHFQAGLPIHLGREAGIWARLWPGTRSYT